MPKKPKRPVKRRVPMAVQVAKAKAADDMARRVFSIGSAVEALIEVVGQEQVRMATAKLASRRSLAALAEHVAAGKIVQASEVKSPGTCAVEFEELRAGEVVTPSVVAELAQMAPEVAEKMPGWVVGGQIPVNGVELRLRRCWDVVTP